MTCLEKIWLVLDVFDLNSQENQSFRKEFSWLISE